MRHLALRVAAIGIAVALLAGCAVGRPAEAPAPAVEAKLLELAGRLYRQAEQMRQLYLDLRVHSRAALLAGDDEQLGRLQKAALYLELARQEVFHQAQMLDLVPDLRPGARIDFFTLRHKAVDGALDRLFYHSADLQVYTAYLADRQAADIVRRATAAVDRARAMLQQVKETLEPLVRRPYGQQPRT